MWLLLRSNYKLSIIEDVYNVCAIRVWFGPCHFFGTFPLGKLHRRNKSGLTLELSQRGGGGGVKAQSKVKGALFATDRFPLGLLSSYLTSMVVLHFLYLINSTLEP